MQSETQDLAVITCSYAPDLRRCTRLCQSIDRFMDGRFEHLLLVPARDVPLFRALEDNRRRVIAVQDLVPGKFVQLPLSDKWWLHNGVLPVRGWIMQQITKLSAALATSREWLLFADSDLQLVRPIPLTDWINSGRYPFFADPNAMNDGEHLGWHHVASKLLGLEPKYSGANYNGQLISWRRSHLTELHRRLEQVSPTLWTTTIARQGTISEYILYGNFIDRVSDESPDQYQRYTNSRVYSCWTQSQLQEFRQSDRQFAGDIVAVHLQSNLGLSYREEEELLAERLPIKLGSVR